MKNFKSYILFFIFFSAISIFAETPANLDQIKSEFTKLADGTKIVYKQYGTGGNTIVFVHGFGCDMNAWEAQFEYFKDKYRLVFLDLPGHGVSDKPHTEYSLHYYAKAVKAVLDATKSQNVVLVGHSLGTAVSRQTIFDYPSSIAKLVDVDGVYCFYPEDPALRAQLEQQYQSFAGLFDTGDIKETFKNFIAPLFIATTPDKVKNYAMSLMPETPQYVAASTMKILIQPKFWTGEIIKIPTLIFVAKNPMNPPNYGEILGYLYSNNKYNEWDDVGHFIMMEKSDKFNRILEEFVK